MSTLYEIINILPLSLLSVMLFGVYAGIPEKSLPAYAICLVFTVWLIVLRYMKTKNRLRSIGIVAVFLVGLGIVAAEEYRLLFIEEYLWVIWVLCFSAGALAAGILMNKSVWLKRAAAAALFAYCVTETVLDREISKEAFVLICLMLFVRVAEEIQLRWKKSGSQSMEEHITRISPFFIGVCLIVYLLPSPSKPYGWQFAKTIYYKTVSCFNRIYGLMTHPNDDYGNIGFSDEGGFLSGLSETDEEVLYIAADNPKVEDFRLVGCMSGDFEDCEWVFDTDTDTESSYRMLDTMETSTAVRKYAGTSRSDYLQDMFMNYESYFYNTKYIFSPTKIKLQATKERNAGISERNGSIVTEKRLQYEDSYSVSCFALNYGNPHLEGMLTGAGEISEEEWKQTMAAEYGLDREGLTYADYQAYRSEVYEKYCHTYDLSDEVREIIDRIQNSSSSRYEAAKKLEYYLGSMEYSTDCGPLPDSVTDASSFLDHFLLSSRKGYCMHYATAFVLMANEMGIPSRYVQGYSVRRGANGRITVRQSDAHAWPEVYFDNFGWVSFEPTPGYIVSTGWEVKDDTEYDSDKYKDELILGEELTETPEAPEEPEEESKMSPLIFIIPSAAVLSFLLMFYIISRSLTRKKYKLMSSDDKFRHIAQQNLRFFGYLGVPMEEGETLAEFSDRIKSLQRQDIEEHLGFIPVYETMLYSDRKITAEDIQSAEKIYHTLRELVKKHRLRTRLMLLIKNQ